MDINLDSTSTELQWIKIGPNNLLVQSLKDLTRQYGHNLELKMKKSLKYIEKAKKIYGK